MSGLTEPPWCPCAIPPGAVWSPGAPGRLPRWGGRHLGSCPPVRCAWKAQVRYMGQASWADRKKRTCERSPTSCPHKSLLFSPPSCPHSCVSTHCWPLSLCASTLAFCHLSLGPSALTKNISPPSACLLLMHPFGQGSRQTSLLCHPQLMSFLKHPLCVGCCGKHC